MNLRMRIRYNISREFPSGISFLGIFILVAAFVGATAFVVVTKWKVAPLSFGPRMIQHSDAAKRDEQRRFVGSAGRKFSQLLRSAQNSTCGDPPANKINSLQIVNGLYYWYSNDLACYDNSSSKVKNMDLLLNSTIANDLNQFGVIPAIYSCASCSSVWASPYIIVLDILTSTLAIMGGAYTVTVFFLKLMLPARDSEETMELFP
ncbi:hypothetical protein BC938DRAFT_471743 [Jimgerdemannia flammicorona]|uniref:Uncharacterized protein n=1 Tax=Jimgerdemannia flammicorona TaxID=994334 RepID=A0A433QZY3_9FUNG|nr:hypothetical protein BC938DRAFT_471743 [Jimgerdemannia flammicorona]